VKFLKTCVTECRYASAIMLIVIMLGLSGVLGGMLIGSGLSIIIPNFVIMPSVIILSVVIPLESTLKVVHSDLNQKYYTRLHKLSRNKQLSSFVQRVIEEEKVVIRLAPGRCRHLLPN
jgi:Na+(H+)/acetate symporter ActP